jgi:GDP/UDP-N,N'-diacetylbacillosamine 2-epimerase (hydrolysing)
MKKILFITSSRADYSLIIPFYNIMMKQKGYNIELLVTGSHLSNHLGFTVNEIINDKIKIDYMINIFPKNISKSNITKIMSKTLLFFSKFFKNNNFDFICLLGDRFEIMAIALSAFNSKIPIIHFYGGEVTTGALDDIYRHLITKLSMYHFTSTLEHKNRVIQLGENPNNVFQIGAIGIENLIKEKKYSLTEINRILNLQLKSKQYSIVTFHPETLSNVDYKAQITTILSVCRSFPELNFVFTKSNADDGGNLINKFLEKNIHLLKNCFLFDSLGSKMYHSLLKNALFVMGNSSSGLIEAPSFNIFTLNLGNRQQGRPRAKTIIDCSIEYNEIRYSILRIINDKNSTMIVNNPFGDGNTSYKFLNHMNNIIKKHNYNVYSKVFFDFKI